jgi:integrase
VGERATSLGGQLTSGVADLGAASQALGHSDLSTTAAIYGHYDLSDLERAMEARAKARRVEEEEPAE